MTTEEREAMEEIVDGVSRTIYIPREAAFAKTSLLRLIDEFDGIGEDERAQACRRALAELDEAKAGL